MIEDWTAESLERYGHPRDLSLFGACRTTP